MRRFGAIPSSEQSEQTVWKTSDETVNNSATLQDDDALTVALAASTNYHFEFELFWSTNDTADFKWIEVFTGTTNFLYFIEEYTLPAGTTSIREQVRTAFNTATANASSGGTHGYAIVKGIIGVANTGNLKLQWAQGTQDASDTKLLIGSRLTVIKV